MVLHGPRGRFWHKSAVRRGQACSSQWAAPGTGFAGFGRAALGQVRSVGVKSAPRNGRPRGLTLQGLGAALAQLQVRSVAGSGLLLAIWVAAGTGFAGFGRAALAQVRGRVRSVARGQVCSKRYAKARASLRKALVATGSLSCARRWQQRAKILSYADERKSGRLCPFRLPEASLTHRSMKGPLRRAGNAAVRKGTPPCVACVATN